MQQFNQRVISLFQIFSMPEPRHFLYKLIAPRTSFHLDMTDDEKQAMSQHMQYWATLTDQKISVLYGPVFDPVGVWGLAIIEVADEVDARTIGDSDPAVASGICRFELLPMQIGMIRK